MKNVVIRFLAIIVAVAAALTYMPPIRVRAQSAAQPAAKTPLAFEVTSVKPTAPSSTQSRGLRPLPGGQTYVADGFPLRTMILFMFRLTSSQLVGGPGWINTDRWDVQAKAEKPSSIDDLHEMFKTMLVDSFKLKFHREMRTLPTLALVVDQPGKMKRNDDGEPFDIPMRSGTPFVWTGSRVPMAYLTWFVSQRLERPVIDRTSLPGFYDFTFTFLPELPPGAKMANGDPIPDLPDIHQALKDQLGLKLESQRGPVEFMVIDQAEKPTEN